MEVYKIKAKKFADTSVNENSIYIIQALRTRHKTTEYSIWEDSCGEYECGEDPIHSGLEDCYSIEEVRTILLDNDFIAPEAQFINFEPEHIDE